MKKGFKLKTIKSILEFLFAARKNTLANQSIQFSIQIPILLFLHNKGSDRCFEEK